MSSEWLPWSSLWTLKASYNVPSGDQGSQPDDISISLHIEFSSEYSQWPPYFIWSVCCDPDTKDHRIDVD